MSDDNQLNLDHDEARALHRVVRAMHDGECPCCHTIHEADRMWIKKQSGQRIAMKCPNCYFSISDEEATAALAEFGKFMDRNLEIFEKWREARSESLRGTP
jgi:Zn-finger protein